MNVLALSRLESCAPLFSIHLMEWWADGLRELSGGNDTEFGVEVEKLMGARTMLRDFDDWAGGGSHAQLMDVQQMMNELDWLIDVAEALRNMATQ